MCSDFDEPSVVTKALAGRPWVALRDQNLGVERFALGIELHCLGSNERSLVIIHGDIMDRSEP